MIRSYLMRNLDTNMVVSRNERLLRKKVLLTEEEEKQKCHQEQTANYLSGPAGSQAPPCGLPAPY